MLGADSVESAPGNLALPLEPLGPNHVHSFHDGFMIYFYRDRYSKLSDGCNDD